jgi:recombinational DNA repair protein RecR
MIAMVKRLLTMPSPLEMAARELMQAQRAKLEAESAREYAYHMVNYNDDRIARLQDRLNELKEQL